MAKARIEIKNMQLEMVGETVVSRTVEGHVDIHTAARMLGITERRVRKMINDGILQWEAFGRDRLISLDSIAAAKMRPQLRHKKK